jgi:hypothetical protein
VAQADYTRYQPSRVSGKPLRPFNACIIRAVMIDKHHLRDKPVLFRLLHAGVYPGVVRYVEDDGSGFWIESPKLIGEILRDSAWKDEVEGVKMPVLFVPTSSLMYLIAGAE